MKESIPASVSYTCDACKVKETYQVNARVLTVERPKNVDAFQPTPPELVKLSELHFCYACWDKKLRPFLRSMSNNISV